MTLYCFLLFLLMFYEYFISRYVSILIEIHEHLIRNQLKIALEFSAPTTRASVQMTRVWRLEPGVFKWDPPLWTLVPWTPGSPTPARPSINPEPE